jgi:hypothetical protein
VHQHDVVQIRRGCQPREDAMPALVAYPVNLDRLQAFTYAAHGDTLRWQCLSVTFTVPTPER